MALSRLSGKVWIEPLICSGSYCDSLILFEARMHVTVLVLTSQIPTIQFKLLHPNATFDLITSSSSPLIIGCPESFRKETLYILDSDYLSHGGRSLEKKTDKC